MTIICDTREKPYAVRLLMSQLNARCTTVRKKLDVGDYMSEDNPLNLTNREASKRNRAVFVSRQRERGLGWN